MNSFLTSKEVREKFFSFFVKNGHKAVPSSSIVPDRDPSLLFVNAGMNQFKSIFLGREIRRYKRAVSIQKCMRAGGKHNDLDNVGLTARHLTFFEMMGNFSFGDYFKRAAIKYAWDFLTKEICLEEKNIYASVYKLDNEAYDIWRGEINLSKDKLVKLGAGENFWQMADMGPCGPSSEIYFDRGKKFGCGDSSCAPGCDCDRFLEIWNLVFMQYDRRSDGRLLDLDNSGVDTGMGLERLVAVLQKGETIFDTDLFEPIIKAIEKETGFNYHDVCRSGDSRVSAFRVVADHIRSISFVVADGVNPSNEGRGYVLRKIIRRALLFAQKLSERDFIVNLVDPFAKSVEDIYKEISTKKLLIEKVLESEVRRFESNLKVGKEIFSGYALEAKNKGKSLIEGEKAFKLYDTYGFPLELTGVLSREEGLSVDLAGFEKAMEVQKKRSVALKESLKEEKIPETDFVTKFVGYDNTRVSANISEIWVGSESGFKLVDRAAPGETCFIVSKETPFFIESGGQSSDKGFLIKNQLKIPVLGLLKSGKATFVKVETPTDLEIGQEVELVVDIDSRNSVARNHTATHLLQAALNVILGDSVKQSGSAVTPSLLRFDFEYSNNLDKEKIKELERLINKKVLENIIVKRSNMSYDQAIACGAKALFDEKYDFSNVRVIEIGEFSKELCGGTHVGNTGEIGCLKITEVLSPSAGNKRIVAVTGLNALELFQANFAIIKNLCQEFKVKPDELPDVIAKQKEILRSSISKIKNLKREVWGFKKHDWLKNLENVNSIKFLHLSFEGLSSEDLRALATDLSRAQEGFYFLTSKLGDRIYFYAVASKNTMQKIDLQNIMKWMREKGFSGGGKKNLQGSIAFDQFSGEFIGDLKDFI